MRNILRPKTLLTILVGVLLVAGFALPRIASASVPDVNALVSLDSSGLQGNNDSHSYGKSISNDGRYIVFMSSASNLVSGDTNGANDIFVRDTVSGTTTRVSVSSSGVQADSSSIDPRISYDGQYVVFESAADNLVSGVTPGTLHAYIHNMQTGTTLAADTNAAGTIGDRSAEYPDISSDGRFVVFLSDSSNLVTGINPEGAALKQVFVKDMYTGQVEVLSINSTGSQANNNSYNPRISCDGGIVVFQSVASNLVSGDTNGRQDIFVDTLGWSANQLTDITITGNGDSENPAVSCDGNDIAYDTHANNLVSGLSATGVVKYDRLTGAATIVSANSSGQPAYYGGVMPDISEDGRYIVFLSSGTTELDASRSYFNGPGFTYDTFIRDTKLGTTQVLSIDLAGQGAGTSVDNPAISADGSVAAYDGMAENAVVQPSRRLVSTDANGKEDVFTSGTGF